MAAVNGRVANPDGFETAYAGAIDFLPLAAGTPVTTAAERQRRQKELRAGLAKALYGPIPSPPDDLSVRRQPIPREHAERLLIEMAVADRRFTVDAALWLPPETDGPAPLICGLDFLGPVGLMTSSGFPIDEKARISSRPVYGARDNRMEETLRGVSTYRWPVSMLLDAGYAVLVSCYGSWVPDDPGHWTAHGLCPLLGYRGDPPMGAISLWAWAIHRLLDAAASFDEIDMANVAVAGHSRLGKAALWAAANNPRIGTVFASNSGCGGSAPAAHSVGETLAQMAERFPHWTIQHRKHPIPELPFDQHHLLSLIAPRAVYLAAANADLWADPIGSFLALQKAADFWPPEQGAAWNWPSPREVWQSCGRVHNGQLGYHLRPGGHDLLPYDWRQFLEFLEAEQMAAHRTRKT